MWGNAQSIKFWVYNDFLVLLVMMLLKNNIQWRAHVLSEQFDEFYWVNLPAWSPRNSGYRTFAAPYKHHALSPLSPPTNHCSDPIFIVLLAFKLHANGHIHSVFFCACLLLLTITSVKIHLMVVCACTLFIRLPYTIPPGDHTSMYFCSFVDGYLEYFWLVQISLPSTGMYISFGALIGF